MFGIEKLIEVVAQGVGALAKPWMLKRIAGAQVENIKMITEALDDSGLPIPETAVSGLLVTDGIVPTGIDLRIADRMRHRERVRQRNIENVVGATIPLLQDRIASDGPVDPDWIARFFTHTQEVSHVALQSLWSRILADEIVAPGNVPLRVLDVLRNVSHQEALAFEQFAGLLLIHRGLHCAVQGVATNSSVATLQDAGLVKLGLSIGVEDKSVLTLRRGTFVLEFAPKPTNMGLSRQLGILPLTETGECLLKDRQLLDGLETDALVRVESVYGKYFDIRCGTETSLVPLMDFVNAVQEQIVP